MIATLSWAVHQLEFDPVSASDGTTPNTLTLNPAIAASTASLALRFIEKPFRLVHCELHAPFPC
jgi:hypothetical protein